MLVLKKTTNQTTPNTIFVSEIDQFRSNPNTDIFENSNPNLVLTPALKALTNPDTTWGKNGKRYLWIDSNGKPELSTTKRQSMETVFKGLLKYVTKDIGLSVKQLEAIKSNVEQIYSHAKRSGTTWTILGSGKIVALEALSAKLANLCEERL